MSQKTILVVGSHGFIGGYVCKALTDKGHKVVGIDSLLVYKPEQWKIHQKHMEYRHANQVDALEAFYRVDAAQPVELLEILDAHKPQIIINVGGNSVADQCKKNIGEALHSIYLLNANLLQCIKNLTFVERYTYISSSMIYGDFESDPQLEDSPKRPGDPYGAIKLGGEYLVESFNKQFNTPFTIIRPSAAYGPLDSNMRVSGIFISNASKGKPLRVSDPNEVLDFTYVEDLANGIVAASLSPGGLNQTFNMTRGHSRTILEFANEVVKYFPDVKIEIGQQAEHMPGLVRPKRGTLGMSKAHDLLGYVPHIDIEQGVKLYSVFWKEMHGN